MTVGLDEDAAENLETTPLNSPEKRPSPSPVLLRGTTGGERAAADSAEHTAGRVGLDLRQSRTAYVLLAFLAFTPVLDFFVLLDTFAAVDFDAELMYGEDSRAIARVAQLLT